MKRFIRKLKTKLFHWIVSTDNNLYWDLDYNVSALVVPALDVYIKHMKENPLHEGKEDEDIEVYGKIREAFDATLNPEDPPVHATEKELKEFYANRDRIQGKGLQLFAENFVGLWE